ncbi:hypothetical protein BOQ62_09675 [Chryseobacterium sp. CH21]|uniref:hypothetical protein n=1 Tax=Chryseobacterium sp. CH21 TaxID=713556 RepID=UPI00100AF2A5|nr:hypothetical protein [Chryseobacterium sp. CH21]RXM39811.1 hypothetical protein BOQ62_09675 [Chryseobacterium sp. CH21]
MRKLRLKWPEAGRGMLEVKICLANVYTSFYKKIFMENLELFFSFNNFPLPASDFLTLLAELK